MFEAAIFCLALNIFHEARSEPLTGQFAVALVTMNRAKGNPRRVCSVVKAPSQFSWTLTQQFRKPVLHNVIEQEAWHQANRIAKLVLMQRVKDITKGSTHYHTTAVKPVWRTKLRKTAQIGSHIFYTQVSQA